MNHLSEPRVVEGKCFSIESKRAMASSFVGVVRDILEGAKGNSRRVVEDSPRY